ncbi:MAG: hypothetical protein ABL900_01690 [Burkholderiaceae bacterium]
MRLLQYRDLDLRRVKPAFAKECTWIDRGTGTDEKFSTRPVSVVDALKKRLTGETNAVD